VTALVPDYVVAGHLTQDLLPDGTVAPGGTVFYGALAAQRLGYRAAMLTAAPAAAAAPPGVAVARVPSATGAVFAHRYEDGRREQRVHSVAAPITAADLPAAWRDAPVAHLGPVLGELDEALAFAFPRALLGATPQGWLRRLDGPPPAPMRPAPWRPGEALLRRIDLLVLSVEDLGGDEGMVAAYARHCRRVAVTRGAGGATLLLDGIAHEIPAAPARAVDTNGAGDVFAAAMLLQLFETGDALAAAGFAAAAAALAVEAPGAAGIPSRGAVFTRLHGVAMG
jgi:sugar/nucleoside kinase (ribokinase family)